MKFNLAHIVAVAILVTLAATSNAQVTESELIPLQSGISDSPDLINDLHQRQWVRLDAQGKVSGRLGVLVKGGEIQGRIGAKVLISLEGKPVFETTTGTDGVFELSGLQPGTYAFQSQGDYTFAAYALHILPATAEHLTSQFDVYASVMPVERLDALLASSIVPSDLESVSQTYYRSFTEDPLASERRFSNSHRVRIRDGVLLGRVSRPGWTFAEQDLSGTIARLVREGEVVTSASVERDGTYRIAGLEPGIYDLIVAGDDGYAVMAFEATDSAEPVASNAGVAIKFVSAFRPMETDFLNCELIHHSELPICGDCEEIVQAAMEGEAPLMCGGCAGGCELAGSGSGGGGSAGGSGIGGLLGLAGLAVGITALADDDRVNIATPIVP